MGIGYISAFVILTLTIYGGNASWPFPNLPIVKPIVVRIPVAVKIPVPVPVYIGNPVDASSYVYPYNYYPQTQYPNIPVTYQPAVFGVQYPPYGWTYNPSYKPPVYVPPSVNNIGGSGDPNNPKKDVEYIYQ